MNADKHLAKLIVVLLALLTAGTLGWWAMNRPYRWSTQINSTPSRVAQSSGHPLPLVISSNLSGGSVLPSGPVTGAADATSRAVTAANLVARRDYHVEPFTAAKATAKFDGRSWVWRKRVGSGLGDYEAEVKIAPDGAIEGVRVEYLVQQLVQQL